MASPNKKLAEAIDTFAGSPGITVEQVAQLRDAIRSDRALLASMNQAANAGQIKGFSAQESSGNLAGTYDIHSGVVTLPAGEFKPMVATATPGLVAVLKLQDMAVRFGNSSYPDASGVSRDVSQEMVDNLQRCINESPTLAKRMQAAVSAEPEPHLRSYAVLPAGAGAGATYDGQSKTINIPAHRLQRSSTANLEGFDINAMTFTLAHETEHGFNHESKLRAYRAFDKEVRDIARDKNPTNDYTTPIGKLIDAGRQDEARAEIGGWNAILSRVRQSKPEAGLDEMGAVQGARTYLFVDHNVATKSYTGKADIAFKPDLSLDPTPGNIEAMGKYYFDRMPNGTQGLSARQVTSLGPYNEADYPNYYGRGAIERLITIDRKHAHAVRGVEPQMHINMAQLRLDERLIERLGLEIAARPQQRQAYYDTSQSPPALRHFDHTKTGPSLNQHVPIDPAILEGEPIAGERSKLTPAQQGHPDHGLYSQIAGHIRQHDQQRGRQWDDTSERMTASLLALAKDHGLSRVDHVVFSAQTERVGAGENVFVVQGALDDPAHTRAHMKTEDAARTPEAESFANVQATQQRPGQNVDQVQPLQPVQDETQKGFGAGSR